MATVSLPYTLQAGQPENVNQLVANLNALVAGVNTVDTAQISAGSVTQAKLADGVYAPIGSIMQYAGATAPTNWLLCDGDAVSRTTYADLFTLLSTTYGSGNGSTTFNVPNLKGKVPVGLDASQTEFDSRGETGGAKTVTLTAAESGLPSHTHTYGAPNFNASVAVDNASAYTGTSSPTGATYNTGSTGGTSASSAHQNMPPYIVVNYIIRAL